MKRTKWLTISLSVAVVLATAFLAPSLTGLNEPAQNPVGVAVETSSSAQPVPGHAALRATINPETGKLEVSTRAPGAPLDGETQQALRRDTKGLEQVFHPSGAVSVHLQGRFQNASVARIDENGKLVICSEKTEHVASMIQGQRVTKPEAAQTPEVR